MENNRFEGLEKIFEGLKNFKTELKYGENPAQKAALYGSDTLDYEVMFQGALSYNNFADINLATAITAEFFDVNAVVLVKHVMPCAVALGKSQNEAFEKALDCDPLGTFGAVASFSQKVDVTIARKIVALCFDTVVAPDFSEDALKVLEKSEELRIIKINTPLAHYKRFLDTEIKVTPFGILVSEAKAPELDKDSFKVVSKKKPSVEMVEDMIFAQKIVRHARSNAAVIAKDFKTVAIAQGFTNAVEAVENALDKGCEQTKDAVLAIDGTLSSKNNINAAVQGRIAGLIVPDAANPELVKLADKFETVVITTGRRVLKH